MSETLHLQTQLFMQVVVEPTKELERLLDYLTNETMQKVMISSKGIFYKQSATSLVTKSFTWEPAGSR